MLINMPFQYRAICDPYFVYRVNLIVAQKFLYLI